MSIEIVFNISTALFLISIFGQFISSDVVSFFIARQIMIASAVINFLNFSSHITPGDLEINILLTLGLATFYLMEFSILYNLYLNIGSLERKALFKKYKVLSFEKNDWWGEDRI